MPDEYLYKLATQMSETGLLLSFSGPFSQGIIEELGAAIKGYLREGNHPASVNMNVFSVFIEQTQNIKNYITKRGINEFSDPFHGYGIVVIGRRGEHYFIKSGNIIHEQDTQPLSDRIKRIQNSSKEELKQMYKDQIRKDPPPGSNGAGLGLIEMARKAAKPMEYSFTKVDNANYFFTLHVTV